MVAPLAGDAEIGAGIAFALEADPLQEADRRRIGRQAGRLDPPQPQGLEDERHNGADRVRHVAAPRERCAHPISERCRLGDAAAYLAEREAAEELAVALPEDEEGVGG